MARRELWDQVDTDLYGLLGVPADATDDQIQDAWRAEAKRTHPDRGGSVDEFQAAEVAYQVLSDPIERSRYNRYLREGSQPQTVYYSPPAAAATSAGAATFGPEFRWVYSPPPRGRSEDRQRMADPYDTFPYGVEDLSDPRRFTWWMVLLLVAAVLAAIVVFFLKGIFSIVLLTAAAVTIAARTIRAKAR